jgi:hypothetical protein
LVINTSLEHGGAAQNARRPSGVIRGVIAALVFAAILTGALAGCSAGTTAHTSTAAKTDSKYGTLPGYLPKPTFEPDGVLTGTIGHPALTTEGDAVRFGSGAAAALVTVTGPEVPGEGLPFQTGATTCTWTVTIRSGSEPVAIDPTDFSSSDHLGAIYAPQFVAGQPIPPKTVAPHSTVTFELRAVMVVGEGLMRWAPDGRHPVASWDFEVEND